MINLEQSLNMINEKVIEMIKKTSRGINIISLTLEKNEFDKLLYGESKLIEEDCDDLDVSIEENATYALVRYQPAAGDLRYLLGILEIIVNLERICDLAAGVMKLIKKVYSDEKKEVFLNQIKDMVEKVLAVMKNFEESFLSDNVELSYLVLGLDDDINEIRDQIKLFVSNKMKEDVSLIDSGINVIFIAQKLERIGDLIQNLAEMKIYISKGDFLKHKKIDA